MKQLPKHTWDGIRIALLGLVATVTILLTYGNNPLFTPVITIYVSLGIGVYFLGLSVVVNSILKRDDYTEVIKEIQQIKNKLDSGIIITQNVTAIVNNKNSEKKEVALLLSGIVIGLWAGILGGIFSSSLFEILSYKPSETLPTPQIIIFITTIILLSVLTLYLVSIIQKLMPLDSPEVILKE